MLPAATDYVAPAAVRDELAKLADGAGAEATAASVGQDLLDRCAIRETTADYADDAVLELARQTMRHTRLRTTTPSTTPAGRGRSSN